MRYSGLKKSLCFSGATNVLNRTPSSQEESFPGFSLKAVREEYERIVASCGAKTAEEKDKAGQTEKRVERPRRMG